MNSPRSNKAGSLINDIPWLAALHRAVEIETVAVYVTDQEMASYYANADNHFGSFFNLAPGQPFAIAENWVESLCPAVKSRLRAPQICCYVKGKYSALLPHDHVLRVYEVAPGNPSETRAVPTTPIDLAHEPPG